MSVHGRLIGIGDQNHGDQEKDANALLIDLDKGLRSTNPGEQCEAIVRFPRLFEKYPFPILINSAFLKLADLFRIGSNFLRQCILRVTQQSEKHLDKIANADEFMRRIYAVIHSNDPIARAITLRTLGCTARIISERKNVHHSIINGLDSHDPVEQEAAIFAALCFAAQSKSFASSICTKLEEMIQSLSTPVGMKLKLIPIFQHMHHDATVTRKVMELCSDKLLPSFPSRAFVQVTLHTMSLLVAKSLLDIPTQVELLLQYLATDCRKSVKILTLQDLLLLAKRSPHVWLEQHIQVLCKTGLNTPYSGLKLGILKVLTALSKSVAVAKFPTADGCEVIEFCNVSCYDSNQLVSAYGAQLFTHLAIHQAKNDDGRLSEDCASVLDMLIMLTAEQENHSDSARQITMSCIVEICQACPSLNDRFIDSLMSSINMGQGVECLPLCHCVSALGSHHGDLMPSLIPDLLNTLHTVSRSSHSKAKREIILRLVTLLLQSCTEDGITDNVLSAIYEVLDNTDYWTVYKLSRQATRYGHHQLAAALFTKLVNKVSSEHNNFWLTALKECCHGETCLHGNYTPAMMSQYVRQMAQAEIHYHNAISALKAASTPGSPLGFHISYLQSRTEMLEILLQVVQVCCSFQTSPPPAIATSLAMTTGQDFHRCKHVVIQLKQCQKRMKDLTLAYNELYKESFDADVATLRNIQMCQQMCQMLVHVLETIFILCQRDKASSSLESLPSWKASYKNLPLEYRRWGAICEQILELLERTIPTPCQATLTHFHIECIQRAAMLMSGCPLSIPRYFYQRLQSTDIQLAISPQPKSQNDTITVHYDTCLTLKVEGILKHGKVPGLHRKVTSVKLIIKSSQQSKSASSSEEKVKENPLNDMTQMAEPLNDYFISHFLLAFPVPGLHLIELRTEVVDDSGATWCMGAPLTLMVKSYDEAVQRQQQQQYAAQRQQQRAAAMAAN